MARRAAADLKEYNRKRDFQKTPEPKGAKHAAKTGDSFVIQKHAASRLHYDFRLEIEGVLKSWAVPKGPSLDPSEKRLAVETEDHPLDYGGFEGIIPEGEYGGGTVMLWDRGRWHPAGDDDPLKAYESGKLKVTLDGEKLHGGWTLVRMGGKRNEDGRNWLLIKEKDGDAKPLKKYDVLEKEPASVETGRSLEEIAAAAEGEDAVWSSNRDGAGKDGASKPKKKGRSAEEVEGTKEKLGAKKRETKPRPVEDVSKVKGAKKASLPKDFRPQLATLVKDVPKGDAWLHEIKFDGYRMLGMIEKGKARLVTRNGNDWSSKFPEIAKALAALDLENAIVDGEVVVIKPDGTTDFQTLQNAIKRRGKAALHFYLFDLPYLNGYDLGRVPLLERKRLLQGLLEGQTARGTLRYSDHIRGEGQKVYSHACRYAMEGIISKKADSAYETRRAKSWVKVKCIQRQEFVIGGWTDPAGSRSHFGALLVGVYEGDDLIFCGKVGTGFTDETLKDLYGRLQSLERKTPPFKNPPTGAEARRSHWVTPQLLAEIEFTEWTGDGVLRHPSFQGLREDKDPKQVVREEPSRNGAGEGEPAIEGKGSGKPEPVPEKSSVKSRASKKSDTSKSQKSAASKSKSKKESETKTAAPSAEKKSATTATPAKANVVAGVSLSNPDRVLYPEQGLTKIQLANYYETVADWILPHLEGRPLTLVRCPRGRAEKCFYQKNLKESAPEHVRGVDLTVSGEKATYMTVDNVQGLIAFVQMGVLEIHPWGSREDKLDMPDRITFDLDPDPGVTHADIVAACFEMRDFLAELGLESFLKTSGGKGFHLVLPLTRRSDWDEVKAFSKAVADRFASEQPKKYIATMSKAKRKGKIFIDYLRNQRGATSVAAYSTRAKPGAPVSTPVRWDELSPSLKPNHYTVENLPARLAGLKSDPWEGLNDVRQSVTAAIKKELGMK